MRRTEEASIYKERVEQLDVDLKQAKDEISILQTAQDAPAEILPEAASPVANKEHHTSSMCMPDAPPFDLMSTMHPTSPLPFGMIRRLPSYMTDSDADRDAPST